MQYQKREDPVNIKLVIVGDGSVGKTCILSSFAHNQFPTQYVPTVFDNQVTTLKVDGYIINLSLWDTAGQEQYSRLRPLAYPGADIFLISFAVTDPGSFVNAKKKWFPELEEANDAATKIFVGNKIDLRPQGQTYTDQKSAPILKQTARRIFQQEMKCKYYQCSALTRQGLKELFDEVVRSVLHKKGRRSFQTGIKEDKGCRCLLI